MSTSTSVTDSHYTVRVAEIYATHTSSLGRILALVAVSPEDSEDPVDQAAKATLAKRFSAQEIPTLEYMSPASPERRYSVAMATDSTGRRFSIMRGELDAILKSPEIQIDKSDASLIKRNARFSASQRRRQLGVAVAEVADDGTIGSYELQGFVSIAVEKAAETGESRHSGWIRVEVWPLSLRLQHWANFILILAMTITGYYILNPFFGPAAQGTPEKSEFLMGWIRYIHFVSAFLWMGLAVTRLATTFFSKDRQVSWRVMWPLNSKEDLRNMWGTVKHYLFLDRKEEAPLYLHHNALQQLTYTGVYAMCILQILTGLSMFGMYHRTNWFWGLISEPAYLIGIPYMRVIHTIIMFILWAFVIAHIYLAVRADILERRGGISAMFNGGVWMKLGSKPVDAPEIG